MVEVATLDTASDQAAEFTPQCNRSTNQNPTKVSLRAFWDSKGESKGGSIFGSIRGSLGGSLGGSVWISKDYWYQGKGEWESCSH